MKEAFDDELGFAPWSTQPIRYIDRTHAWYDALGYGNPYRYAQYAQVPFSPLRKPLAHSPTARESCRRSRSSPGQRYQDRHCSSVSPTSSS